MLKYKTIQYTKKTNLSIDQLNHVIITCLKCAKTR